MTPRDSAQAEEAEIDRLNFHQERSRMSVAYVFDNEGIDYCFNGRDGTEVRRRISWASIPSNFYFQTVQPQHLLQETLLILIPLVTLALTWFEPDRSARNLLACLAFGVMCWVIAAISPWLRPTGFTKISLPGVNLIIFKDRHHDKIVGELARRRTKFLKAMARIDSTQSARQNLKRFKWLVGEGVLSIEEFSSLQSRLVPSVEGLLLKPRFRFEDEFRIVQSHLDIKRIFDFKHDHLIYQSSSWLSGGIISKFSYENFPSENKINDHIGKLNILPLIIYVWYFYPIVFLSNAKLPNTWHYGAFFVFWLVGAWFGAKKLDKYRNIPYVNILPEVSIIIDEKQQDIFDKISERRAAMLKSYAEPDPLMSQDEYKQTLDYLIATEIISESEMQVYLDKNAAIQAHLSLDERGLCSTLGPAQETVH